MVFIMILILAAVLPTGRPVCASETEPVSAEAVIARPSSNGRLHVEAEQLADENGTPVQLRGPSTHGLTWFPDFINEELFQQISEDWNCNVIRLAMYSSNYCSSEKEKTASLELLEKGIRAAAAADLYVIADWHILEDSNPNENIEEALDFFDMISARYADCPNLIFEICNEPNRRTDWSDIVRYSEEVIPVIRKNMPDAVISQLRLQGQTEGCGDRCPGISE